MNHYNNASAQSLIGTAEQEKQKDTQPMPPDVAT
jgi:hypothetical protein